MSSYNSRFAMHLRRLHGRQIVSTSWKRKPTALGAYAECLQPPAWSVHARSWSALAWKPSPAMLCDKPSAMATVFLQPTSDRTVARETRFVSFKTRNFSTNSFKDKDGEAKTTENEQVDGRRLDSETIDREGKILGEENTLDEVALDISERYQQNSQDYPSFPVEDRYASQLGRTGRRSEERDNSSFVEPSLSSFSSQSSPFGSSSSSPSSSSTSSSSQSASTTGTTTTTTAFVGNRAPGKLECLPVQAVHFSRSIDIVKVFQDLYKGKTREKLKINDNSVVICVKRERKQQKKTEEQPATLDRGSSLLGSADFASEDTSSSIFPRGRKYSSLETVRAKDMYAVYFHYGACVFFNCDDGLIQQLKNHARRFSSEIFEVPKREERMRVVINPTMEEWSRLEGDELFVKGLNHDCVQTIAGVLGQAVALMHYELEAATVMEDFQHYNASIEKYSGRSALGRGPFRHSERLEEQKLFRLIARNNRIMIDIMTKLRVLDRKRPGDAEWDYEEYNNLWESLRDEYEVQERFESLESKLDVTVQNTKFFLEVIGTRKSERLEWYIIFLIALEVGLALYDRVVDYLATRALEDEDEDEDGVAEDGADADEDVDEGELMAVASS